MNGNRAEVLSDLIELSEQQGYITLDDVIDESDKVGLSIQDLDWLSNLITTKGIIIYDKKSSTNGISEDDDFDDFSHRDYNKIFGKVIEADEALELFINEVKSILPPQYREIAQLKYQVQEGNRYARERMIEMHLRMAVKIALQRTEAFDLDIVDAISYAYIGLINAVDRYDPDTSGAFGSYAAIWIQQILGRESPTQRPLMYYPVHKKEGYYTMYSLIKEKGCLQCKNIYQCRKLLKIVCDKLGCNDKQANDVIEACIPFESIDVFVDNINELGKDQEECDRVTPKELISEDDLFEIVSGNLLQCYITGLLRKLKNREREIIIARYGLYGTEEKTLEEVGKMYGLTRERIRQIEVKVLKKLGIYARLKGLREFL